MNGWTALALSLPWIMALLQVVFFADLFLAKGATSGEAVLITALIGVLSVAVTLLAAALVTWKRGPRTIAFAVALCLLELIAGAAPAFSALSHSLPSREEFDEAEFQRARAVYDAFYEALDQGDPTKAQAVLDAHPEDEEAADVSLFARVLCHPRIAELIPVLERVRPRATENGRWLQNAVGCADSATAVRAILDHGASMADATRYLHHSRDPNVIALLIEHGAPVDARDGDSTPLMRIRSNDITRVLLKHGADPNVQNDYGGTPLHVAAIDCREEPRASCFEELLRAGANPLAVGHNGSTPAQESADYQPDNRPHPALVAAEHAWRCAMLVPDGSPALPGCTTPPVSQTLLLERLLDPALFDADLATAQALLAPLGPFYELTPLPTVRQLRRITEDYIFLVGFEPAQQPALSHPWLARLRVYVAEDELRAAIKPFTLGELGTDEEHHVPVFRLPGARSIVVYDDSEPGVVVDLHRAHEPEAPEKARRK